MSQNVPKCLKMSNSDTSLSEWTCFYIIQVLTLQKGLTHSQSFCLSIRQCNLVKMSSRGQRGTPRVEYPTLFLSLLVSRSSFPEFDLVWRLNDALWQINPVSWILSEHQKTLSSLAEQVWVLVVYVVLVFSVVVFSLYLFIVIFCNMFFRMNDFMMVRMFMWHMLCFFTHQYNQLCQYSSVSRSVY